MVTGNALMMPARGSGSIALVPFRGPTNRRPAIPPADRRNAPIREPALGALRRSAAAMAGLRLGGPRSGTSAIDPDPRAGIMSALPVTIDDVRRAEQALAGAIAKTPLVPAPGLSESAGCEVWLKLETQHPTGSFKERGALNKLLTLNDNERGAGVVAM